MPVTLSPLDAAFLHVEDDRHPMQLAGVLTFAGPAPTFGEFRSAIAERLGDLPHFTRRLSRLGGAVKRAQWVDDDDFDLDNHLSEFTFGAAADDAAVLCLIADLTTTRLDAGRPQWRMALVNGLEGGRFGIALTVHHCMVDGLSIMEIFSTLFTVSPDGSTKLPTAPPAKAAAPGVETVPGKGLSSHLRTTLGLFANTNGRRLSSQRASGERLVSVARLPLADVTAVRRQSGVTINTVMLAAVAGGLRNQFTRADKPIRDMYAFVPVNRREAMDRGFHGNQIAMTYPRLPVSEVNPRVRLQATADEVTRCAVDRQADTTALLVELTGAAPNAVASLANRLFQYQAGIFDLTITNVPGPPIPVYFLGRRLESIVGSTPLTRKHPVTVALLSYAGEMTVAVTCDPKRVPHGGHIAEDIVAAFRELEATFES